MLPSRSWLGVLLGGAASFSVACLLNLDGNIACGDGYVDLAAGEECDPDVPSSYVNGCQETPRPSGVAACDPETCRVLNTVDQCVFCGDGFVDRDQGEECDGDNLDGNACPVGGQLQCKTCKLDYSNCETCGNGVRDEGEQCDPKAINSGDIAEGVACTKLTDPPTPLPYASGLVTQCRDTCKWQRTTCSYCGNDQVDGATLLDADVPASSTPEICDGTTADPEALHEHCSDVCSSSLELRCAFQCADDCKRFDPDSIAPPDLGCCRDRGELCPQDGDPFPCCWSVANPEEPAEKACEPFFDGIVQEFRCK